MCFSHPWCTSSPSYPNRAEDPEHETFLHEIGEVFGTFGVWALVIIYGRTLIKLAFGQGGLAQRLVPNEVDVSALSPFKTLLNVLNRTHVFVGVAAIAVILLHIAMVGLHADILFFPAVLALVLWQGLFGFFLTWRYSPQDMKKVAYVVHAQLLSGIMIGIFSLFGHLLLDDRSWRGRSIVSFQVRSLWTQMGLVKRTPRQTWRPE